MYNIFEVSYYLLVYSKVVQFQRPVAYIEPLCKF